MPNLPKSAPLGVSWVEAYEDFEHWLRHDMGHDGKAPRFGAGAAVAVICGRDNTNGFTTVYVRRATGKEIKRARRFLGTNDTEMRKVPFTELRGRKWKRIRVDIEAAGRHVLRQYSGA